MSSAGENICCMRYGQGCPSSNNTGFFRMSWPRSPALEIQTPDLDVPVGIVRKERKDQRSAYSLYVPENYTPHTEWPLIVCLHSGYSREDDYLLTWLRAAKSKGYMLLAPKSVRGNLVGYSFARHSSQSGSGPPLHPHDAGRGLGDLCGGPPPHISHRVL